MKTFLALVLSGTCTAAAAQAPATNPMPDGSFDRYIGLGVVSAQAYQGTSERRVRARALLQLETSSGIFISGMSAGMHLSRSTDLEFGPLLALDPGRDASGLNNDAGGLGDAAGGLSDSAEVYGFGVRPIGPLSPDARLARAPQGLEGLPDIKARLQGGVFANYYLTPQVRLVSSVLYGAGNEHDGIIASVGVQRLALALAPHHTVTLGAGLTFVNSNYNRSYFGVSDDAALASGYQAYAPRGGIRDVHVSAGWNWALSPAWIVSSNARLSLLTRDARHSPLVERAAGFTVTTGLAYRF